MIGEEEITTVEEYLKVIKEWKDRNIQRGNTEDFLFRGQSVDHPLIPKIARLKPKDDLLTTERSLLHEFKRSNPLLLDTYARYDDWDFLTLGQHFGLPTRLLDWSNNALTALWFATGTDPLAAELSTCSVVWILMGEETDFDLKTEEVHPFEMTLTKIFRPRIIKQRINNQSGVFSIQATAEIKEKIELNQTNTFKNKLLKIKIPADKFVEIRADLNTLGVNAFTIFPELEGLCAHLQWRYFFSNPQSI
ncbi:MAG TPA: FRG domain-containing protein [Sphingobacteriaceae bacterium]